MSASDPDTPLLTIRHSGGGENDDEYDLGMHAWLWPAPESDSCRLVCDWRSLNIPEQSIAIETNQPVTARKHAITDRVLDILCREIAVRRRLAPGR